jgi:hypothetical protein
LPCDTKFQDAIDISGKKNREGAIDIPAKKENREEATDVPAKKNREEAVDTTFTYSYEIIYYCKTIQEGQQNIANKLLRLHS